jgi:beta-1,4-mannosyltransferase
VQVASQRQRRRVVIVSRVKGNPYAALLCQGLRQPELGLEPRLSDQFSLGWMWRQRHQVEVLHLHWLELFFIYPQFWRSLKRWLSVMAGLLLARLWGVCVVYTVHNVWQHEGRRAGLVWLGNHMIFVLAQAVHVHDGETAEALAHRWGRRRGVHVIPHGNYISAYPQTCSRAEARARLGLAPEAFVYLFLGRVRPYKGIEELVAAFRALAEDDAVLLIAGEAQEPEYAEQVRRDAAADGRIRLALGHVADESLQVYFRACDVCVLPYRHVTTSGAGILALSFGVPLVAPRLGCFVELVGQQGERGLLYAPDAPDGLREALRAARRADLAAMGQACRRYAENLSWEAIAQEHAAMYQSCARK